MSATDVVPPPAGPNIQDLNGPTIDDRNPVQTVVNPDLATGPDGRVTGDAKEIIRNENPPTPESFETLPTSENKDQIKVDINKTEKADSVEVDKETKEPNKTVEFAETPQTKMDHVDVKSVQPKGNSKGGEIKLPDKLELDSGKGDEQNVVDIVKQSKLGGIGKKAPSEMGEFPEFPQSRPLTETSFRDGTKMSYDTERELHRKEIRTDPDRESSKTPFSVTVERKPLHTAQTRSHSDYYSKTPSSNRYTNIASSLGQFYGFSTAAQMARMRRPPKLVRLATVTMSPKTKPAPRGPSLYYEEPKKPQKVITWDEAHEARPPLRIDMEGPGPTQYSPRNRPLNETNSPAWTFGARTFTEKGGGSRTSWEKTWFQTPEVWTSKVDFYNDSAWPTPVHYKARPMLGPRQRTMVEAPSFTIGTRKEMTMSKMGSEKEPSPVDYNKDMADKLVLKKAPSFSHQFRREGTVIWSSKEKGPGPGSYSPNYTYNKPHGPSFSIRSLRREKSHVLGPFSTF